MRILHFTTHLNRGGISNYILTVSSVLQKRGHQVYVASSGGEMEEEMAELGLRVKNFAIRTKSELHPKLYLALPSLISWLRREKIDLIHAHTRITQVMSAWVHTLTGKHYITTAHGFYKRRLGRRLLPAWGERAVAISDPVAEDLRENLRVAPEKIRVVYNGVDLKGLVLRFSQCDEEKVRREYGIPVDAKVIGITARLVPDKGHEFLIRALRVLEAEFPDLYILIVGDGRHRSYLEDLIHNLKLHNRVVFTGNLKDVVKPLRVMDVFVLPAVWREGFGLSIVEAMACQKPVIATNIWALNALIQNGVNGILVEPRNVEALASAVSSILKDPGFRLRLAKAGQQTAMERFSLERMALELEAIYEEVLRG